MLERTINRQRKIYPHFKESFPVKVQSIVVYTEKNSYETNLKVCEKIF